MMSAPLSSRGRKKSSRRSWEPVVGFLAWVSSFQPAKLVECNVLFVLVQLLRDLGFGVTPPDQQPEQTGKKPQKTKKRRNKTKTKTKGH